MEVKKIRKREKISEVKIMNEMQHLSVIQEGETAANVLAQVRM